MSAAALPFAACATATACAAVAANAALVNVTIAARFAPFPETSA